MQVAVDLDTVFHRGVEASQRVVGVVNPSGIIGCGQAILRDDDRYAFAPCPCVTDANSQCRREVLPAGQGLFGIRGNRLRTALANERPQICLDA